MHVSWGEYSAKLLIFVIGRLKLVLVRQRTKNCDNIFQRIRHQKSEVSNKRPTEMSQQYRCRPCPHLLVQKDPLMFQQMSRFVTLPRILTGFLDLLTDHRFFHKQFNHCTQNDKKFQNILSMKDLDLPQAPLIIPISEQSTFAFQNVFPFNDL